MGLKSFLTIRGSLLLRLSCSAFLLVTVTGVMTSNIDRDNIHPRIAMAEYDNYKTAITYMNATAQHVYDELKADRIIDYTITTEDLDMIFTSLSYDFEDYRLFFSDATHKEILRMLFDGGIPEAIYTGTSGMVDGITVDWLANNVYWTDALYNWIKVSDFDGTHYRSLVTTGLDHPSGIVCNPQKGYLYWSDVGRINKIEKATLAGEKRSLLLDENSHGSDLIGRPTGLTIDFDFNRLYWVDSENDKVMGIDLNSENAQPVLFRQMSSPHGFSSLDIDPDFGMLVTDRMHNELCFMPYDSRRDVECLFLEHNIPKDVIFFSKKRQPDFYAPCENAGCNQLCVSDPAGFKCLCTYGHQLQADGKTCERDNSAAYDHEMIFSIADEGLCTFPPNIAHQLNPLYRCFSKDVAEELDVNVYGLQVFTVVKIENTAEIRRVRLETSGPWDSIVRLESSEVRGIAVDWVALNLYIADAGRRAILISSIDGSHVTTLINSEISQPTAIVVHAVKQYLFWTDIGPDPRIERSDLSGRRDRRVLVNTGIESPTHLVIDMQNDRIFWLDGGTLLIESIEFDGQGREIFYDYSSLASSPFSHFTGLAIFQDLLYITEAGNLLRVFDKKGKDIIRRLIFPSEINTMKFFHESLQPLAQGPCDVSNGGCDEICINTKYGAECVCSTLYCTPVFRCPHTIANGKLAAGCDNRNGQSCDFTCNIGYFRTTDQPVICTEVGGWNVSSNDLCRLLLNCVSEPCQNDGNCTDTDDGFTCTCPSQWHGNVCDIPISSIEKRKGGDIAAVLVSVFVIIFVITAIVLFVLFRRKIFRSCRKTDRTFDGIVSANKADENAYSGAPTAPHASAPIAPMDQSLYNQPPFELTMQSIDRSSQQQQWNVVSAIAHANVAHLAYPNVKEAASTDFHLYMAAQADEHVYDALPSTMNNDDYHTPAEMFPGTSENEGSEDTDGEDTGDYTSMKSHKADCEYITPIAAAMSESSNSGDKLGPMDFETTPTTK